MPLLTLLNQARAFGLGVVLATQNPVDLDYKGLANAGTWFIGRLQTDRDKERVLDGLEGAATGSGGKFDRQKMEELLAGLASRVFLMNNVHDDAPEVFETRWCMSYLRGPMTRTHIKALMDPRKAALPRPAPAPPAKQQLPTSAPAPYPAEERQEMLALAQVRFTESRRRIDFTRDVLVRAPLEHGVIRWQDAREEGHASPDTAGAPPPKNAERDLINWLYSNQKLELFHSRALGETSRPGESERDFRIHLQQLAHEKRDLEVAKLRAKYAPKIAALEDKISRAEQTVEREKAQQQAEAVSSAVNIGSTLLGALFGRKVARSAA